MGVPLVFCSKCLSNPKCLDTHTTPFSEHDLFVRCCGFTTPYRRPIHRKSRDLRSGRWDMSIFSCCFPILGCVFPLISGQASSTRRLTYWRRCPTVAWFARSQACYVLTVLTIFWCCVSKLLCIYSGTDHRALEAGGVVHDENHVHAGLHFFSVELIFACAFFDSHLMFSR